MEKGRDPTKPAYAASVYGGRFVSASRVGRRPRVLQYRKWGSSSIRKVMNFQAPSLFLAALNMLSVSEKKNDVRFFAGPTGIGSVAKFASPTNFFCSSIEPELWRYMLVTPRPKPSTIWR